MSLNTRQEALERYHKERIDNIERFRVKEEEKRKHTERISNYSRYVKEMYFPKVSKAKHDEIEDILSKLKINMSSEDLHSARSPGMKKNNSILKLRDIKSSLATPSRTGRRQSSKALRTLDKYAVAVNSILERNNEETDKEIHFNKNLNWGKKNPMVKNKYIPPKPKEFHDETLHYLDELR